MVFICTHEQEPKYTLPIDYQIVKPDYYFRPNIWDKTNYKHVRHIYFIWRNLDLYDYPNEVFIFQHRRYLNVFSLPYNIDVVCPGWSPNPATVYDQYCLCHSKNVIDLSKEIVNDKEYDEFLKNPMTLVAYHNMFGMRRSDFMSYSGFLFYVLEELENKLDDFSDAAYISERLGAFYIWKNFFRRRIAILVEL